MFGFKKKEKPLSEKAKEAMSVRDIHGNLPVMPIVNADGTIEALYGPITLHTISDSKIFMSEEIK